MKKTSIYLVLSVLVVLSPIVSAQTFVAVNTVQLAKNEAGDSYSGAMEQAYRLKKNEVDGTTSASQLRAKRSHSASKENESKLTVFLGLFAIAIILFFIYEFTNKK